MFWCVRYLQLLLLEHVRSGGVEYVVSELSLTIYVDRCCSFTGQEAVVDLSGTLRELEEVGGSGRMSRRGVGLKMEGGGEKEKIMNKAFINTYNCSSLLLEGCKWV